MAPETLDRRLAYEWVEAGFVEATGAGMGAGAGGRKGRALPVDDDGALALPGLVVFYEPVAGRAYVVGVDPAEGNPRSDESAASNSKFRNC